MGVEKTAEAISDAKPRESSHGGLEANRGRLLATPGPTANDIRKVMADIDREIFEHVDWLDQLNTILICREPFDAENLRMDAEHCCAFGRWYDGEAPEWLRHMDGFAELGESHRRMHEYAAGLLIRSAEGRSITKDQYKAFLTQTSGLRHYFLTLKQTLENQLIDFDPLTGAGNRIGMGTKLHQQQELVNRRLADCMLVMMDIDFFKQVNDTYGHDAGDRALVAFAQYIMHSTRPFDMLFRYGGEEFLLCAPEAGLDTAFDTVERIRKGLQQIRIPADGDEPDGKTFHITASFGIAFMVPGMPAAEAIRRADIAVYAAKEAGRNCTRIWSPGMTVQPVA